MSTRDRAGGWKHAKLTGHKNEAAIEELIRNDIEYQKAFLRKIGKPEEEIAYISVGGLHETNVDSVFPNEKTKSKTDMQIVLKDGNRYNIPIKKSLGGQVYLISDSRFIKGFELQYGKEIPQKVKRAIELFWGSAPDVKEIIEKHGQKRDYETRKHRLVAETLLRYNEELYFELLNWFAQNTNEITDFCFSKGLAKNAEDWANIIWYKNELGENSVNEIFIISEMCTALQEASVEMTEYGTRGGTALPICSLFMLSLP